MMEIYVYPLLRQKSMPSRGISKMSRIAVSQKFFNLKISHQEFKSLQWMKFLRPTKAQMSKTNSTSDMEYIRILSVVYLW
jgi:hypothetical protein